MNKDEQIPIVIVGRDANDEIIILEGREFLQKIIDTGINKEANIQVLTPEQVQAYLIEKASKYN